jgi:hypothetical protein
MPLGQCSYAFANLVPLKKLAMPLPKSWIVLLLYTIPLLLSAKQLLAHERVRNDAAGSAFLSAEDAESTEDLTQLLRKHLPKNEFTQWLLHLLFTHPPALQETLPIAAYVPYAGNTIGLIQLEKQGGFRANATEKKYRIGILFPTTQDWVILDQLSFVSGDTLVPHKLAASQKQLSGLLHIKEAAITVQECKKSSNTVDIYVTTQDRFPISLGLDLDKPSLSVTHNNLFGWGHRLQNKFLYDQGLGYCIMYSVPDTKQLGALTGELQYLNTEKKSIKSLRVVKNFTDRANHAGKIEVSKIREVKWRILDGNTSPQSTTFSCHYQCAWLGTALDIDPSDNSRQGRLFLTGKLAHRNFVQRPEVTKSTNRYFHDHVFGVGSLGFSNKRSYEDELVYGVGRLEPIVYGSKVNLTGGYQFGEFVNRPYLRLDITQGKRIQKLGHFYGAASIGGFFHEQSIEQGILQLQLRYFTPILGISNQSIRQFINLNYLTGHNMFTGELISTNINEASADFRDPFLGGTQRLHLGLETVLLTPMRFVGCQVAALGFVDAVRLQDTRGKVRQGSFCKALGIGLRCAHPRFSFGTLQVKVGYSPLTQNVNFAINIITGRSDDLDIGEPDTISFQETSF